MVADGTVFHRQAPAMILENDGPFGWRFVCCMAGGNVDVFGRIFFFRVELHISIPCLNLQSL